MPTVLLGPLMPEHLANLPARRWIGEIHYLVLDCPDEVRRERIETRPAWRNREIEEQTRFGRRLRENIAEYVDTNAGTPQDAANAVAAWVTGHL